LRGEVSLGLLYLLAGANLGGDGVDWGNEVCLGVGDQCSDAGLVETLVNQCL